MSLRLKSLTRKGWRKLEVDSCVVTTIFTNLKTLCVGSIMLFMKSAKKQFKMEDGYSSIQEMLKDVISVASMFDFRKDKITVYLPSEKFGGSFTDKLSISYLESDKLKFSLFESEAQSYLYNKIVLKNEIVNEITKLISLSGNAESNGYELEQF